MRSSYPYEVVAEGLQKIVNMKQYKEENLVKHTERFKHEKSVIKTILGINFLDKFVESTKEFQHISKDKEKQKLKAEAFEKWMAALYIKNSDQRKYGSLLYDLQINHANKQKKYPQTVSAALDVMSKVKFNLKETGDGRQNQQAKFINEERPSTSFAQRGKSGYKRFCCGSDSHMLYEYDKKESIPRDQ